MRMFCCLCLGAYVSNEFVTTVELVEEHAKAGKARGEEQDVAGLREGNGCSKGRW